MCTFPRTTPVLTQDRLFREISSNNLSGGSSLKSKLRSPTPPTFQWETSHAPGLPARRACIRAISRVFPDGSHSPATWKINSTFWRCRDVLFICLFILGGVAHRVLSLTEHTLPALACVSTKRPCKPNRISGRVSLSHLLTERLPTRGERKGAEIPHVTLKAKMCFPLFYF